MFTLYNVVSSDGFIADKNGNEDFIPDEIWPEFLKICKSYGALVMGRKTYEAIQDYGEKLIQPFEELPIKKIVVSNTPDFAPKNGYTVVRSPEDVLAIAPDALVSSGPILNNYLLENQMVKKIILRVLPVALGAGMKPFDEKNEGKVLIEKLK